MAWEPGKIRFFAEKTTAPTVNDDENDGYRESDIWIDETNDKAYVCLDAAAGSAAWTEITGAGTGIAESLFDANTILKADSDNTPEALTVGVQTLIGRITAGVIAALTPAQVRTLINVEDGAKDDQTKTEIDALGLTHDSLSGIDSDNHHVQGADTTLGTQAEILDMGGYRIQDLGDAVDLHDGATLHDVLNSVGLVMNYWLMPTSLLSSELVISIASAAQEITGVEGETELTTPDTFFKSTVANTPTPFVIKDGTIILTHFEAKVDDTSGTKPTTLHAELWRVDSDGSTTPQQIGSDSNSTDTLTEVKTLYQLHLHVPVEKIIVANSRLWLRIFATTTGESGNPDVRIYNGDVHGHVAIPVSGSILGRFLLLAGGTMTGDIAMGGSQQVTGLQAPAASGEAIRQTTNITEANLEAQRFRYIQLRVLDKDTSHEVADGIGGDFRLKVAMTVISIGAYFDTAGSGSVTTVEIFEAGTTILSTDITVDDGEKTSEDAATPPVVSDSAIAADGILTFNISGIASGTAGKGLVVWLVVTIP